MLHFVMTSALIHRDVFVSQGSITNTLRPGKGETLQTPAPALMNWISSRYGPPWRHQCALNSSQSKTCCKHDSVYGAQLPRGIVTLGSWMLSLVGLVPPLEIVTISPGVMASDACGPCVHLVLADKSSGFIAFVAPQTHAFPPLPNTRTLY